MSRLDQSPARIIQLDSDTDKFAHSPNFPLPNERLPPPLSWKEYRQYYHDTSLEVAEDVPSESALAAVPPIVTPYDAHAGYYRTINPDDDLNEPWKSSPPRLRDGVPLAPDYVKPVFDLPESFRAQHAFHSRLPKRRAPVSSPGGESFGRRMEGGIGSRQFSPNSLSSSRTAGSSSTMYVGKRTENGYLVGTVPVASSVPRLEGRERKSLWERFLRVFRRPSKSLAPFDYPCGRLFIMIAPRNSFHCHAYTYLTFSFQRKPSPYPPYYCLYLKSNPNPTIIPTLSKSPFKSGNNMDTGLVHSSMTCKSRTPVSNATKPSCQLLKVKQP